MTLQTHMQFNITYCFQKGLKYTDEINFIKLFTKILF